MKIVPVRFNDIDSQGHASHLAILEWVAEARIEMLDGMVRQAGLWGEVDYVLVKIEAEFLGEIKYPGEVMVAARIGKVGRKSVSTTYQVGRGSHPDTWVEDVARATCVSVFFDVATKKTVVIPPELRCRLEGWA